VKKTQITAKRIDTTPLLTSRTARRRRVEAMIVGVVGLLSFLGFGSTVALWSSSDDIGDAIVQGGDLAITIDQDFTWKQTVWTDPDSLPPGMEYAPRPDGGDAVLVGEVIEGENGPIPMGGDWTTLQLRFTGTLTKIGDNLFVMAHLKPHAGMPKTGVSYTVTMTSPDDPSATQQWDLPGADPMEADGYPMSINLSGERVDVEVIVQFTGDALGIAKQVGSPSPVTLDPMFTILVSQVRP